MTAKIKLNSASGGGSFSLQAPSSSSNNRVFTLPDSADATLLTSTASLGKFASYAIIGDQKASGDNGGTFTSGAWRTRDINTEFADDDNIVSISSNQFTLQAGQYFLRASAPAYKANRHVIKLQNITDGISSIGTTAYNGSSESVQGISNISTRFTIGAAKTFEIQHYGANTEGTFGFGVAHDIGGFNSIYTLVEIFKEL